MAKTLSSGSIRLPKPLLRQSGVVVLSLEEYDRFKEDLEMASSKKLADEITESREDLNNGKVYSVEAVERMLSSK